MAFTLTCCFMAIENFTDHCRRVYFATEDFSAATFIIVNAGLFYLFQERVMEADNEPVASEYQRYCSMCRDNLETALANLSLLLPAKVENIEALLLGVRPKLLTARTRWPRPTEPTGNATGTDVGKYIYIYSHPMPSRSASRRWPGP